MQATRSFHTKNLFPMSEGVSEVSERISERCEQTDKRVAQYSESLPESFGPPRVTNPRVLGLLIFRVFISFHKSTAVTRPFLDNADFGSVAHVAVGTPSPVHVAALFALPIIGSEQPLQKMFHVNYNNLQNLKLLLRDPLPCTVEPRYSEFQGTSQNYTLY